MRIKKGKAAPMQDFTVPCCYLLLGGLTVNEEEKTLFLPFILKHLSNHDVVFVYNHFNDFFNKSKTISKPRAEVVHFLDCTVNNLKRHQKLMLFPYHILSSKS